MSIFVVWDEPHRRVMHFVYRPQWTNDHLEAALVRAGAMLKPISHPLDLFIDQQQVRLKPRDFLLHAQRLTVITRHRHVDRVILLGVPHDFNALRRIAVHQENPFQNYYFAPTLDDAFEFLFEHSAV